MEAHPSSDVEAALAMQEDLARRVVRTDDLPSVDQVTGVDVAYAPDDRWLVAAAVTLDAATLEPLECVTVHAKVQFPYVPGLFSFREAPAVIAAVERLEMPVQLIVCDGHGIAHPRRFGLACHLGVVLDVPTIGCAKSRLMGTHENPLSARGGSAPLMDGEEVIGAVLRTQDGVRPVYASIGHRVSLNTACDWILRLSPRFRLPETTRAADHEVREALRQGKGGGDQGRRDSAAGSTG